MANQLSEFAGEATLDAHPHIAFCEITACPSKSEALFFLESHNFDLDAAVSTFLDDAPADLAAAAPASPAAQSNSHYSPSESLSQSPFRSRSPSPPPTSRPYSLCSAAKSGAGVSASDGTRRGGGCRGGGIHTLIDLNKNPKNEDSDSDPDFDPQEYYTRAHERW